jgi:hypothetical protein
MLCLIFYSSIYVRPGQVIRVQSSHTVLRKKLRLKVKLKSREFAQVLSRDNDGKILVKMNYFISERYIGLVSHRRRDTFLAKDQRMNKYYAQHIQVHESTCACVWVLLCRCTMTLHIHDIAHSCTRMLIMLYSMNWTVVRAGKKAWLAGAPASFAHPITSSAQLANNTISSKSIEPSVSDTNTGTNDQQVVHIHARS